MKKRQFLAMSAHCAAMPALLGASKALWAMPSQLRVRKNLMSLDDKDPFFEKYGQAVAAMHALPARDLRSWWGQATIHANHCSHGTANFVTWHRPYLLLFESICAHLIGDPGFTLHYWDWSQKAGILPNPFYDMNKLNVTYWRDRGVYNGINWGPVNSLPVRALGRGVGLQSDPMRAGAFTSRALKSILNQSQFSNFTNMLERQPHNTAHVAIGFPPRGLPGHMGSGLSSLDPIFWMHHTMVDYMWAQWQKAGNVTTDVDESYTGMFVDANGRPASFSARQVHDFESLGYTYDTLINEGALQQLLELAPASGNYQLALRDQLANNKPQSLANASTGVEVLANTPASIKANVPSLLKTLQGTRVFSTQVGGNRRLAFEGKRVLAVLKHVGWPQGEHEGLMVNAFVNCPDLTPSTSTEDPHYAGTFSFFGAPTMNHAGGHDGHSVIFDITAPLLAQAAQGSLNEDIQLQLVSIHPNIQGQARSNFQVKDLEIISV